MDNNPSERALRAVAISRKNWLFFSSDDHAEAAANIMSLIASCKLHGIDSQSNLELVIRALPTWPCQRDVTVREWVLVFRGRSSLGFSHGACSGVVGEAGRRS
jgi:transposase